MICMQEGYVVCVCTCKYNALPLLCIYTSMMLARYLLAIYYHYGLQSPPASHPYLEVHWEHISKSHTRQPLITAPSGTVALQPSQ